jgi:hypothetical protein
MNAFRTLLTCALAALTIDAGAAAPPLPGPAFPHYRDPAALRSQCTRNLKRADAAVRVAGGL